MLLDANWCYIILYYIILYYIILYYIILYYIILYYIILYYWQRVDYLQIVVDENCSKCNLLMLLILGNVFKVLFRLLLDYFFMKLVVNLPFKVPY